MSVQQNRNQNSVIIAGIDPSIRKAAIVWEFDALYSDVIDRPNVSPDIIANVEMLNRLEWVGIELVERGIPVYVCIEEQVALRGAGELAGVAYWSIIQGLCSHPATEVYLLKAAPTQVKKFVTNNGRARTSEVTPVVVQRWPQEVDQVGTQEDTLMALAMMKMATCAYDYVTVAKPTMGRLSEFDPKNCWTKFQWDIIEQMVHGKGNRKSRLIQLGGRDDNSQ